MPIVHEEIQTPYSVEQMFILVNDVKEYSKFLPLCCKSEVLTASDFEMHAILGFQWKGISKEFSTVNKIVPNNKITMSLENGPFERLVGNWTFQHGSNEHTSVVLLDLEFSINGSWLNKILSSFVHKLANDFIDGFTQRAKALYG